MIHVATVHWQDERWIAPQLRFLDRFLPAEHRVYAALNGIDPAFGRDFFYAADLEGKHPEKLNQLAEVAREQSHPDDLLLFVDGDAFPIAPVGPEILGDCRLAAIRRDENVGDCQPHPSFCLTTVGFWSEIGGDWRRGYKWTASTGDQVTDVGGNLLGILRERDLPWRPLLRSNRVNLDPIFFGVYGDVAYHHGAGFRRAAGSPRAPPEPRARAGGEHGRHDGPGAGARAARTLRALPARRPPAPQARGRRGRPRAAALRRGVRGDPDR